MKRKEVYAAFLLVVSLCMVGHGATVSITLDSTYQTIDGFGFFGGKNANWCDPKPSCIGNAASDPWFDRVIGDLGLTIIRQEYYSNESGQDATWSDLVPFHQAMKSKADQLGEPLKFFCSFWSPPSSMKSNGSLKNGGSLLPAKYADFGQWASNVVQDYKNAGVDLYALSLQNEPEFEETYNSCVYTGAQYRDMMKVAVPIIKQKWPNLKILGPETMLEGANTYAAQFLSDLTVRPMLNILAYHGYHDGVNPTPSSLLSAMWDKAGILATNLKIPVWMTETSGYTSAFEMGMGIFSGLKYGKMAGWVMWQGWENVMNNDANYATAKSFYRYIRPGAKMVKAVEDNQFIHAVAFNDQNKHTFTIVVLNTGTSAVDVNLDSKAMPASFTRYLTAGTTYCQSQGTMAPTASFSAPAQSITTLFGGNFTYTTGTINKPRLRSSPLTSPAGDIQTSYYSIDGRPLRSIDKKAHSRSIVVRVHSSETGTLETGVMSWF